MKYKMNFETQNKYLVYRIKKQTVPHIKGYKNSTQQ